MAPGQSCLRQLEIGVFQQGHQLLDMLGVRSLEQADPRADPVEEARERFPAADDLAQSLPDRVQEPAQVAAGDRLAALVFQVQPFVIGLVLQHQERRHPAADAELLTIGCHQLVQLRIVQGQQAMRPPLPPSRAPPAPRPAALRRDIPGRTSGPGKCLRPASSSGPARRTGRRRSIRRRDRPPPCGRRPGHRWPRDRRQSGRGRFASIAGDGPWPRPAGRLA